MVIYNYNGSYNGDADDFLFFIIMIVYFVLKKYLQKYMLHLISLIS